MKGKQLWLEIRQNIPRNWLTIWLWVMSSIIVLGIATPSSSLLTLIKLFGVFCCVFYTISVFPKNYLLQLAMLSTFIADIILATNNLSEPGLITFVIAQLLHSWRMHTPETRPYIIICGIAIVIIIALGYILNLIPNIFVICTCYGLLLLANLASSWLWKANDPKNFHAHCAVIGFTLFVCCDTCVIMSYLALNHFLPALFYGLANFFAWFFYFPSQIFVANSPKCATMNLKEGNCATMEVEHGR